MVNFGNYLRGTILSAKPFPMSLKCPLKQDNAIKTGLSLLDHSIISKGCLGGILIDNNPIFTRLVMGGGIIVNYFEFYNYFLELFVHENCIFVI